MKRKSLQSSSVEKDSYGNKQQPHRCRMGPSKAYPEGHQLFPMQRHVLNKILVCRTLPSAPKYEAVPERQLRRFSSARHLLSVGGKVEENSCTSPNCPSPSFSLSRSCCLGNSPTEMSFLVSESTVRAGTAYMLLPVTPCRWTISVSA